MGFEDEGFNVVSHSEGRMEAYFGGELQSVDYKARNFINSSGTIAYVEIEADGRVGHIFLSRTAEGDVLTIPGMGTALIPLRVEGYKAIFTIRDGGSAEESLEGHLQALGTSAPLADEAVLRQEVQGIPQRSVDVVVRIFKDLADASQEDMDKLAGILGGRVGDRG